MEGTDLCLMRSVTVSDALTNGGRQSFNQITSGVLNNLFPNVSQSERTVGHVRYRKFFFRNKNASDETSVNSRFWISALSTGDDRNRIKLGTDVDTQEEADDYTNWKGSGYITSQLAVDSTSFSAEFGAADGIQAGDILRLNDGSGTAEFLTVAAGGVSWAGTVATITLATPARGLYPASTDSIVSACLDIGDLVAGTSGWSETSGAGTYNESTYPVEVNNLGTVDDEWTLTFTSASAFTISGSNTGSLGAGSISGDSNPINPNIGSGAYYFIIRASGWGGTWQAGDTVTFTTSHSSKGFWIKEIIPSGCSSMSSNVTNFMLYCEGS